jgi:hypothetical protein
VGECLPTQNAHLDALPPVDQLGPEHHLVEQRRDGLGGQHVCTNADGPAPGKRGKDGGKAMEERV